MNQSPVYVVAAARTAIGTFGGSLKDVPLADLATTAVQAALSRSGAPADAVGHLAMGTVVPTEPRDAYLSRVAAVNAGLPKELSLIHI
jgi:acetyl-CoA C-acetyltransferase